MSVEKVKDYLKQFGKENDINEMGESTATVPLAAAALGVIEARIAKSLSLKQGEEVVVIVVAGDGKIDNRKYKDKFGVKAKMLKFEELSKMILAEVFKNYKVMNSTGLFDRNNNEIFEGDILEIVFLT